MGGGVPTPGNVSFQGDGLWYDFSDRASLGVDTFFNPVVNDGDPIGGARDKGPLKRDVTHGGDGTTRPIYKTGILNGKSIARFDGVNDWLRNVTGFAGKTHTIFIVANRTSAAGVGYKCLLRINEAEVSASSGGGADNWIYYDGTDRLSGYQMHTESRITAITASDGVENKLYDFGGAPLVTNALTDSSVGASLTIGATGGVQFITGDIAEIIVYGRVLSAAELDAVGEYLATKWGLYWAPTQVAGLAAHYDFANRSTLFKDTARTLANIVTADADVVLGVTDKSQGGKHLSVAANGPQYKTAIQNARSVGRFDGVDDTLGATNIGTAQPLTMFLVRKADFADVISNEHEFTGHGFIPAMEYTTFALDHLTFYAGAAMDSMIDRDTSFHVAATRFNGVASNFVLDGGRTIGGNAGAGGFTNGQLTALGSGSSGGLPVEFFDGDICEALLYSGYLSDSDVDRVGRYLAAKWGTTWSPVYDPGAPSDMTGLFAWYDFSRVDTLWKDTARTDPVTADDDPVAGVTDLATNNHLAQATLALRPLYKTGVIDGKSILRSDGLDDRINATFAAAILQPGTVFFVCVDRDPDGAGSRQYYDNVTGAGSRWSLNLAGGTPRPLNWFAGANIAMGVGATTSPRIYANTYNGASSRAWADGGAGATGNVGGNSLDGVGIGSAGIINLSLVDTAEMIIFNRLLSIAEINAVGEYLAAKWGITWTTAV